jgi:LexA-binding, inner membrane-associated putative hydrolase
VAARRLTEWLYTPTLPVIALVAAVFFLCDWTYGLTGGSTFPGGLLDETAHLLTTLLVLWAIGRRVERFLVPALLASVLIDIDHLPAILGSDWLTAGTPRPYSHSLLTVIVVLLLAAVWRRRRDVLLGVAAGLAIHFWRDLADPGSGMSMLWPITDRAFATSHAGYLVVMGAVTVVAAYRARPQPRSASGHPVPQE